MRKSLILRVAISCGALAAPWGDFGSTFAAEQTPSLSAAISADSYQLWPGGDPNSMLGGPVLSTDPLSPIPMTDADLAAQAAGGAGLGPSRTWQVLRHGRPSSTAASTGISRGRFSNAASAITEPRVCARNVRADMRRRNHMTADGFGLPPYAVLATRTFAPSQLVQSDSQPR